MRTPRVTGSKEVVALHRRMTKSARSIRCGRTAGWPEHRQAVRVTQFRTATRRARPVELVIVHSISLPPGDRTVDDEIEDVSSPTGSTGARRSLSFEADPRPARLGPLPGPSRRYDDCSSSRATHAPGTPACPPGRAAPIAMISRSASNSKAWKASAFDAAQYDVAGRCWCDVASRLRYPVNCRGRP